MAKPQNMQASKHPSPKTCQLQNVPATEYKIPKVSKHPSYKTTQIQNVPSLKMSQASKPPTPKRPSPKTYQFF